MYIVHIANSVKNLCLLFLVGATLFASHSVFAEDADAKASADKVLEDKKRAHLMSNIDIFGKTDLPAIYILMPNVGDDEIKGSILTRDFSRDDFFMQNVDREEFEMKITLRETGSDESEKKKDEAKR